MTSNIPEKPGILDITSVAYGSKDYTSFVRSKFDAYLAQNPESKSWSFLVDEAFFGEDPNKNIYKACVVVYRNTILSHDRSVSWSQFKSQGIIEGQSVNITFDGANDTEWSPPGFPDTGQFIVSAYWYNKDVTAAIQNIAARQVFDPYKGITFSISPDYLGPDPNLSKEKQFCITYGNWVYPGQWSFHIHVDINASSPYSTSLPVLFPPVQIPNVLGVNTYVTFHNVNSGQILYPQVYGADMGLFWDGRAHNFEIPTGIQHDVDLCGRAGCQDREKYYCGWSSTDGSQVWGCGTSTIIASSSSMARGCAFTFTLTGNSPEVGYDFANFNKVMTYRPAELRLNIYSATWGGSDYTDFVRQKYISYTIQNPPTNSSNAWSIPAKIDSFGADPNQYIPKTLVIIYRVAYRIGTADGIMDPPNAPEPWDPLYAKQNIQPLSTDQYPVLSNVTDFRFVATRESGTFSIDLLAENLEPWTPPPAASPFIAMAVWSNTDVTAYVQKAVTNSHGDTSVSVGVNTMGGGKDPWQNVPKQLTVLAGYGVDNNPNTFQWQTLVKLDGDSWYFTVPNAMPTAKTIPKQLPLEFVSTPTPCFSIATFKNNTTFNCWPQIVLNGGQIFWDGRAQAPADKWKILPGGSCDIRLVDQANCVDGSSYGLTFTCEPRTFPPFTGWIKVSMSAPNFAVTMTYAPHATSSFPGKYIISREVKYLGP